ncbi:GDP-L-fucose synthase family protein [Deinococcus sp. PESE-13]
MKNSSKIYVAGHRGLVGSAIMRRLQTDGYTNIVSRTSAELDLRDQTAVRDFFSAERPEYVFLAAAKVGGILANSTYPAQFLYDNLMIAANVIHSAHEVGVRKLLNLGSSCIYPRLAPQPLREEYLLTGPLEETNRAYAVAKIAAIELCDHYRNQYGDDFISAMPTNLYGPGDNFDLSGSHVLPALMRKMVEARQQDLPVVEVWGSGTPLREFLYVDDLADACLFLMENVSQPGPLNVGTGEDLTIRELAETIADVVGYQGKLAFDASKPDGTPRKLMDVSRLAGLGWKADTGLREGIERTYTWYVSQADTPSTSIISHD